MTLDDTAGKWSRHTKEESERGMSELRFLSSLSYAADLSARRSRVKRVVVVAGHLDLLGPVWVPPPRPASTITFVMSSVHRTSGTLGDIATALVFHGKEGAWAAHFGSALVGIGAGLASKCAPGENA